MFYRLLEINKNYNSFLFGARSTGKTTYLQRHLDEKSTYWFDLLDIELEDRLAKHPNLLLEILAELSNSITHIVIDEIQKLPRLLDLVHSFLQKNPERFSFILTGSSARKLKAGGADLLAGRAFFYNLFPLTPLELGEEFSLTQYLEDGGLPQVYKFTNKKDRNRFLKTYGLMYLKEEVWNEHLIKKLDPFRNFLEVAAQANGDIVNFTKISRQIRVDVKTVQGYFDILKDTLLGFYLEAYNTSIRKQIISSPKFYFFDTGVKRALDNTLQVPLVENTYAFGRAFEHFLVTQFHFYNHYFEMDYKFYYLKTKDGAEIDIILERPDKSISCIEIKSTTDSSLVKTTNLRKLGFDLDCNSLICFSRDYNSRRANGVHFLHWEKGLELFFPEDAGKNWLKESSLPGTLEDEMRDPL